MASNEILHSRHWSPRWCRRRDHTLNPQKWRQHQFQSFHHGMRRFTDCHHAQFFEITQIYFRFTAHQHRALAEQLALHGRGNIDGCQRFVENLPGKLLQLRHEGCPWSLATVSLELRGSTCSAAVAPQTMRRHSPPQCTPFSYASLRTPTQCAAPVPHLLV